MIIESRVSYENTKKLIQEYTDFIKAERKMLKKEGHSPMVIRRALGPAICFTKGLIEEAEEYEKRMEKRYGGK
jgi:hypothetical protein